MSEASSQFASITRTDSLGGPAGIEHTPPRVTATLRIFTYRQGLLSRFGHDLQLTFDRFNLEAEEGKFYGRFQVDSVRVLGAMRDGGLDENALSSSDRAKIEETVRREVLQADRYPEAKVEAAVESRGSGGEARGSLTLLGRRLALPLMKLISVEEQFVGGLTIEPSRWGVKPYRAMAGALKLKDEVAIEIAVPVSSLDITSRQSWSCGG